MHPSSLKRAFAWFVAALGLIGLCGGASLIFFTTSLHRAARDLETAVESVRIAEEIEIELLTHWGVEEDPARAAIESRLQQLIQDAALFVGTAEEGAILARVRMQFDDYRAAVQRARATEPAAVRLRASTRGEFDALFGSARELIRTNVEQSRALRQSTSNWGRIGNLVGITVVVLMAGGMIAIVVFVRSAVVQPATELAATMARYATGDRGSRAREQGTAEFQNIAKSFNDMASSLERQRQHQLLFLAGVAHDIRNPLSALKMASAIIAPDHPLPAEERVRASYARIQRQVDRLERMVRDFSEAARVEMGQLDLKLELCDARQIASAAVDLFEPAAPAHRFTSKAPGDPVLLTCDPARIEQVLNNLVSNAVKYSPRGGNVVVAVQSRSDSVVLSVSDEGLGIPPAEIASIFEPFRRTGASRESIPGVGLGLFVARRIVEAHGGRLTVDSTPGKGSTFEIWLPHRSPAATVSASPERAAETPPRLPEWSES